MKTLLTLLLSFSVFTTVFAQTDAQKEEAKRVILGEKKGSTSYPKSDDRNVILGGDDRTVYGESENRYPRRYPTNNGTDRDRQVYDINRAYDAKIYSIQHNRTLSRNEKVRIIRQLEEDRRRELDQRNGRYNGNRNGHDDHKKEYKKSKKNKGHNGNHYGWEKGKGNPHDRY